jgi:hypothetical protein
MSTLRDVQIQEPRALFGRRQQTCRGHHTVASPSHQIVHGVAECPRDESPHGRQHRPQSAEVGQRLQGGVASLEYDPVSASHPEHRSQLHSSGAALRDRPPKRALQWREPQQGASIGWFVPKEELHTPRTKTAVAVVQQHRGGIHDRSIPPACVAIPGNTTPFARVDSLSPGQVDQCRPPVEVPPEPRPPLARTARPDPPGSPHEGFVHRQWRRQVR